MSPTFSLSGKVVFVTGSTGGIGLGVARQMAKAGAHIALNGFGDAAEIEKTRSGIESEFGVKAVFLCSEEARGITGAAHSIDGGWSTQ